MLPHLPQRNRSREITALGAQLLIDLSIDGQVLRQLSLQSKAQHQILPVLLTAAYGRLFVRIDTVSDSHLVIAAAEHFFVA